MLVARSFSTKTPTRSSPPLDSHEKQTTSPQPPRSRSGIRGFGWRPSSYTQDDRQLKHDQSTALGLRESPKVSQATKADVSGGPTSYVPARTTPSKPMPVPRHAHKPTMESPVRARDRSAYDRRAMGRNSRPTGLSPPVVAIHASTAIPRRSKSSSQSSSMPTMRRMSGEDLIAEWKRSDTEEVSSLGTSPAMQTLLETPTQSDDEEESSGPTRSDSDLSMVSTDTDSQSGLSNSMPSTPGSGMHRDRRKVRTLSSPKSIECGPEHPLLQELVEEPSDDSSILYPRLSNIKNPASEDSIVDAAPPSRKPSAFRSSLTASLNNLRSNISRTFSNFSAPSNTMPDDQILRGFLGTPYHPEMRPRPIRGVPDPKLRRYLNPHAFQLYDFHLHNSHVEDADHELKAAASAAAFETGALSPGEEAQWLSDASAAIALQPYQPRPIEKGAKRGADATEAGRARNAGSQQQRREPRENPEFLRIAVLELQFRRAGKSQGRPVGLGAASGRRGWWLPPRALDQEEEGSAWPSKVPRRWQGVSVG